MKPGATARPSASIVRVAAPLSLPISTILPFLMPTSPRNAGIPEPSTISPFVNSRSYAIGFPPEPGAAPRNPQMLLASLAPPAAQTHLADGLSHDEDAGVPIIK